MRTVLSTILISIGLVFATPAMAQSSKKFKNTNAVPVSAVKIEVVLSEDLEWRANNLPKDRKDRGRAKNNRDGFGGNGFYGERDLSRLVSRLEKRLTKQLEKKGVVVDPESSNVLRVTLDDVRPTHPTFSQISKNGSLSMRSIARGGASFVGTLVSENGEAEGNISYAWYENDICDGGGATWSDTNRAIDRFARHTAKSLAWN